VGKHTPGFVQHQRQRQFGRDRVPEMTRCQMISMLENDGGRTGGGGLATIH
jgi:hypothetical protein